MNFSNKSPGCHYLNPDIGLLELHLLLTAWSHCTQKGNRSAHFKLIEAIKGMFSKERSLKLSLDLQPLAGTRMENLTEPPNSLTVMKYLPYSPFA